MTDIHAHWIPGVDDGVKTFEEACDVIEALMALGYKKLIATPHIMADFYGNSAEGLLQAFSEFSSRVKERGYPIELGIAAEYYLDEVTLALSNSDAEMLTFGKKSFLLFETNMITEPLHLKEFIFRVGSRGFVPVMAHPERYQYMTVETAEDLRNRGVLLQINMLSLTGYYGPPVQKMAAKLIDRGWVDFLGSDCHHPEHARLLGEVWKSRLFRKAAALPLLNFTL